MRLIDGTRAAAGLAGLAVLVGCLLTASSAFAAGDANMAGCASAVEASPGFRVSLPDCRAYEIVSEANTHDTSNVTGSYGFPDEKHVYYESFLPSPGSGVRSALREQFLATRTSSGWVHNVVSPPQGEGPSNLELGAQALAVPLSFTADFQDVFVNSPFRDPFEVPQLNESLGMGVYELSLASGTDTMMSLPDSGALTQGMLEGSGAYRGYAEVNDWGSFLAGVSADGRRAFFVTNAKLATAPGTPVDTHEASDEVYERYGGHTYLVGVLPDGEVPVCGAEVSQGIGSTVGTEDHYAYGAVAPSGDNVVFSTPGPEPGLVGVPCAESETGLFLRNVVNGTTVKLPDSLYGGRAGVGGGEEEVIFTLGSGIQEYHVGTKRVGEIGDGNLLTYSSDGSRVYFRGPEGGIYLYEEGKPTTLIPGTQVGGYVRGTVGGGMILGGAPSEYGVTANMPVASGGESDGSHLLFIDSARLTEYENEEHFEAYVYDAETERVTCISCNPRDERPVGVIGEPDEGRAQLIDEFSMDNEERVFQNPSPPFISNDGSRAVFETNEPLLPQDVNETMDVYEWARVDTNGCGPASGAYSTIDGGCLYLLSSGLGKEVLNFNGKTDGTHLVGASENLNDVYIQTSESLLPGLDNSSKLYDVRIDGGFPYSASTPGCEAEQCTTGGGGPVRLGEPVTEAFAGPGNVKPNSKSVRPAQTRRLKRALRLCRRHGQKRRRIVCEREVRRRYAASASRAVARGGREGGVK